MQDLLSDTGLGREMHVIVGQGQLDEVLNAGPDARRALIEEAAGVLKHRKRKEKALRKLDAMQVNLTRLVDLTGELGRQLKPLGRQAEIARKAAVIQADLRDARLRLLADDYVSVAAELDRDEADEAAAAARRAGPRDRDLTAARAQETELEPAEQQHAPRLAAAQEAYFELSGLAERLRGVPSLAAERHRHLMAPPEPQRPGRDPDELEREAASLREQERRWAQRLAAAREHWPRRSARAPAPRPRSPRPSGSSPPTPAPPRQRAERLARLRGQVAAARSQGRRRPGRGGPAGRGARRRPGPGPSTPSMSTASCRTWSRAATRAAAELAAAHERPGPRWRRPPHSSPGCARPSTRPATAAPRLAPAPRRWRRRSGAAPTPPAAARRPGTVRAACSARLRRCSPSRTARQEAIAAALGAAAGAVAVSGLDAAAAILAGLKDAAAGTADLVIAGGPSARAGRPAGPARPRRCRRASGPPRDLVKAPGELAGRRRRTCWRACVVAADLASGLELLRGPAGAAGGHQGRRPARGALGARRVGRGAEPARPAGRRAGGRRQPARGRAGRASAPSGSWPRPPRTRTRPGRCSAEALAGLQEVDAAAAEISGRLGTLAGAARAATDEAGRLAAAIAAADRAGRRTRPSSPTWSSSWPRPRPRRTRPARTSPQPPLTPEQARAERERLAARAAGRAQR